MNITHLVYRSQILCVKGLAIPNYEILLVVPGNPYWNSNKLDRFFFSPLSSFNINNLVWIMNLNLEFVKVTYLCEEMSCTLHPLNIWKSLEG